MFLGSIRNAAGKQQECFREASGIRSRSIRNASKKKQECYQEASGLLPLGMLLGSIRNFHWDFFRTYPRCILRDYSWNWSMAFHRNSSWCALGDSVGNSSWNIVCNYSSGLLRRFFLKFFKKFFKKFLHRFLHKRFFKRCKSMRIFRHFSWFFSETFAFLHMFLRVMLHLFRDFLGHLFGSSYRQFSTEFSRSSFRGFSDSPFSSGDSVKSNPPVQRM